MQGTLVTSQTSLSVAMYATSMASTPTSGSRGDLTGAVERRIRVIRLLRPRRAAPAFGFSLRGGKEYATGFFVSKVEHNSEAHLQGLKVGDQLVTVNGYRVDDAVHAELVHYITSQSRLKIKVRHVGMLPIREKEYEPLSWQFVSERSSLASEVSSSPTLCHNTDHMPDLRLSILVPPRAKLGCGICKGPEWKPGIFVQFVREGGIAKEAGLRPGDQILSCNGLNFSNISFNEAVSAMKVCGRLELIVREGAGAELVSPESSGYNSSASSAAGERSPASVAPVVPLAPPAALRRRLASVAEEAADRADRLTMNRMKRRTWDSLDFEWKNGDIHNFDAPSDIEPDYDSPSIPNNPHTYENKTHMINNKVKNDYEPSKNTTQLNRTIINLTEDGATIQCSYDNSSSKKPSFTTSQTNRENEKKTIVVEVHHNMNSAQSGKAHCNYPAPPKYDMNLDTTSISSSATLSSAIVEEIQRRKLNMKKSSTDKEPIIPVKKVSVTKPVEDDKKKHHDALMDEFKKVHRKMFANQENEQCTANDAENNMDRQHTLRVRKSVEESIENLKENHIQERLNNAEKPPPPPPMPISNGHHGVDTKNGDPKPKTDETNFLKSPNVKKVATVNRTPTPDYNNKDIPVPVKAKNYIEGNADIDSLESYKLQNPSNMQPRPPSNYFSKAPNGTATMKKHSRPVSVTIGEYVNNMHTRREPSKLEFLNGDTKKNGHKIIDEDSITSRLQSELAMTLSRSNLRKKTEAMDCNGILARTLTKIDSVDENFHARYGNNLLPLPPTITIPKVTKFKH
ncbi:ribonuclease 3 isoform X1 [Zerene cesonia]|uniref:ribonuclease 3 isoform X1 n=2 Tax=Zerene cesonia TaxID=33412 RepID=UPI0018E54D36|nr:ribonuclease 3 isoform X1 [Zerene cesonia]